VRYKANVEIEVEAGSETAAHKLIQRNMHGTCGHNWCIDPRPAKTSKATMAPDQYGSPRRR